MSNTLNVYDGEIMHKSFPLFSEILFNYDFYHNSIMKLRLQLKFLFAVAHD